MLGRGVFRRVVGHEPLDLAADVHDVHQILGQVSQKPWISKRSSRGAANSCQHAVRLDTKGKNSRAGHRMRRTQPGRSIEHCQRKPATEKADQSIGKGKQTLKRNECVFGGCSGFFCCQPSEIGKEQRLMYIAIRTDDGRNIGKISFYCNTLQVSRQAFYDYLERKGKPWK